MCVVHFTALTDNSVKEFDRTRIGERSVNLGRIRSFDFTVIVDGTRNKHLVRFKERTIQIVQRACKRQITIQRCGTAVCKCIAGTNKVSISSDVKLSVIDQRTGHLKTFADRKVLGVRHGADGRQCSCHGHGT